MDIIYFLIPVSLLLVVIVTVAFLWAARGGQFRDLERHGSDIFYEDGLEADNKGAATEENKATTEEHN